ncbi:hypothetical protein HID58_074280 [Brassica napus]|uniref:DUF4283 domain-containing protein n=1 Tax=Brassica napus TaxID=3708 RepID=A0ABQ7YGB1_BRANA|nr:hypothetical protein HID58_074280 [Brassica napus]
MPSQWGMQDRITANDLGNGRFLFNFTSEDDLNLVLSKGPFHYNYCMFVLVRWEPVIHDDYPWTIPFWVVLSGIPLHLWNLNNLKSIGGRLGHIDLDSIQVAEGRMLINIDSRLPPKFSMKHCSTCGSLTHEKGYCPSVVNALMDRNQNARTDVFARVQLPQEQTNHQPFLRDHKPSNGQSHMSYTMSYRLHQTHDRYNERDGINSHKHGREVYQPRYGAEVYQRNNRQTDRVIRAIDERQNRYGSSRTRSGPYDRKQASTWRAKHREEQPWRKEKDGVPEEDTRSNSGTGRTQSRGKEVPTVEQREDMRRNSASHNSTDADALVVQQRRKIASTIVTPSRVLVPSTENITYRSQELALELSFSPNTSVVNEDVMVIEALSDMDITGGQEDGRLESAVQDEDLLGLDLMEYEAVKNQTQVGVSSHGKQKIHPSRFSVCS